MANIKIISNNRRAHYNYQFLEIYEAGVQLNGPEVKSIKSGHISINEAFAAVKEDEIWLINAHVPSYKPASQNNNEPTRSRKLLLNKKEVDYLLGKVQTEGLTLVPTKVYLSHGLIKIEIALARGKKIHDKREVIKKRDIERDLSRELKNK